MKRRLFLALGLLCSLGYYSCQKYVNGMSGHEIGLGSQSESSRKAADCGCDPIKGSNIFDPTCLVSPSAHGKLDTIQKGFGFTEGPAVNKWGDVFFTDQPNDKIYKWEANSGQITTFLTGTGRSNGMAFDRNGYLIACADMHG